jgi:filamentous hemagglutinin family protein
MRNIVPPACFAITTGLCTGLVMLSGAAIAQVIPDGTLPTNVTSPNNLNFAIGGGSRSGNNLFHSFSQFSVPTGGAAVFNNAADIQNIFSRVTGGNVSSIDGLIQANGTANLFLLNPNGILFGPNASLNIGGSFIGTTANSVKFADGVEFSAVNANGSPLLTMSVPIGLQMGATSGSIQVQGPGHTLNPGSNDRQTVRPPQLGSLQVPSGKTLALMGNNIQLSGGILTADSGQVALGSVGSGNIQINTTSPQWGFSYDNISNFSDIKLTNAALIDASGNPGGGIQLQGKTVQVQDTSALFIQTQGTQNAGTISVHADVLELSGALPNRDRSLILSEKVGTGKGADINISVRKLLARDGGLIYSILYQTGGNAGNITVNATESIQLTGFARLNPTNLSGLNTRSARGGGKSGNVSVTTQDLRVKDGAFIGALVFGGAGSGNIRIIADSISLTGENPLTSGSTGITATSFSGGDAGSIDIDTGRLSLIGSGNISASTSGNGNAGNITIHARDSIEVDGSGSVFAQRSRIIASGQLLPPRLLQALGVSGLPTGNGGDVNITTPSLQIRNQGYIAAENAGTGDAGRLVVNANSIVLDQQGEIRTATKLGQGGLLSLTVRDALLLRHNSLISAKAGGSGNGGNITINSPIILGLENSDIIANAFQGKGGNITITTQGIIGLAFRNTLTPRTDLTNDITASSQFSVNGTVQINNIGVDPNSGLVNLPVDLADPTHQIAQGCSGTQGSSFVVTGRGGVPLSPMEQMMSDRPWADTRDLSALRAGAPTVPAPAPTDLTAAPLVQATGWRRNPQTGKVELYAETGATAVPVSPGVTCAGAIPAETSRLNVVLNVGP